MTALLVALLGVAEPPEQWTRGQLKQVRALLVDEYVGPHRVAALAAVDEMLDGLAFGQPAGRDGLASVHEHG